MKKLMTLAVGCLLTSASFAQTETGKIMLGGDASFASASNSESDLKMTTVSFNPNVGYFFIDNLAGGLRLQVGSATTKFDVMGNEIKSTSTSTSIAPFLRYYFVPLADNIKLFADGSFGFGSAKIKANGESNEKQKSTFFTVAAGPAFFLTENTALEVKAFYNSTKVKDVDSRTNMFGLAVGFQIHL